MASTMSSPSDLLLPPKFPSTLLYPKQEMQTEKLHTSLLPKQTQQQSSSRHPRQSLFPPFLLS